MNLELDRNSPLPLGEQLTSQLRVLITCGRLGPGEALPTVKELAAQLSVNANTVAAAYAALEQGGWLVQRKKAGTRVADEPPLEASFSLMSMLAGTLAVQAARLGLDAPTLLRVVAAQLALRAEAPRTRVAALARSPLKAAALAERASALFGERFFCVPQTPEAYDSSVYHFTLVDPELSAVLGAPTRERAPLPYHLQYSPAFPAAAD